MKRILIILLCIVLSLSLIFIGIGCKEEAVEAEEEVAEAEEEVAEAEEEVAEAEEEAVEEKAAEMESLFEIPEGEVTLNYWLQDGGAVMLMGSAWVEIFEEKYPNINIEIFPIMWADLTTKLIPAISSGTEGDIMWAQSFFFAGMDVKDLFLPLSPDIYPVEIFNQKLVPQAVEESTGSDGEVYSIGVASGIAGMGFMYNEDMVEEAGVDIESVKTYDDILDLAKKVGLVSSPRDTGGWFLSLILTQGAGKDLFDADTGIWNFDIPEAKKAAELIKSFVDEGAINLELSDFQLAYGNELVGLYNSSAFVLGYMAKNFPDMNNNYMMLPPFNGEKILFQFQSFAQIALSKRLEGDKKNAALLFIKEVLDNPDYYNNCIEDKKFFQPCTNSQFIEYLNEKIKSGGASDDEIIYNEMAKMTENIIFTGTEIGGTMVMKELYNPFLEYLSGDVTFEDAAKNMSELLNQLETEARL